MKALTALILLTLASCAHETYQANPESGVNPEDIKTALNAHVPKFRSCYQAELDEGNPSRIKGQVVLSFSVSDKGRVTQSNVQSSDIKDGPALKCMKLVLDEIQFPVPLKGKTYNVNQPMNLWPGVKNL